MLLGEGEVRLVERGQVLLVFANMAGWMPLGRTDGPAMLWVWACEKEPVRLREEGERSMDQEMLKG